MSRIALRFLIGVISGMLLLAALAPVSEVAYGKSARLSKNQMARNRAYRDKLYERIKGRYEETLDPRYAAARLWVDGVIFPHETRKWLIKALEACALNPEREPFRIGVFQV